MIHHIRRWGNSASLRIPARMLKTLGLDIDSSVNLHIEKGKLIVEPVHRDVADLDSLLDRITPESCHGEISYGAEMERESW